MWMSSQLSVLNRETLIKFGPWEDVHLRVKFKIFTRLIVASQLLCHQQKAIVHFQIHDLP